MTDAWTRIGDSEFVSLVTYRRSGDAVATPVWIAPVGEELVVTTERWTGKVKRIQRDPRVTLTPCARLGAVEPGAVTVSATARISGSHREDSAAAAALQRKYGLTFRLFMVVEPLIRRVQRKSGDRVIIRMSRDATG